MSRRDDSKPLGDEGREPSVVVEEDENVVSIDDRLPKNILVEFDVPKENRIRAAHDWLAGIVDVRRSPSTAIALYRDVGRSRPSITRLVTAGAVFLGTALLIGPFTAVPAALAALYGKNVWNTLWIRRKAGMGPKVAESRSRWAYMCYRFVRIVDGYNMRVVAVGHIRNDALLSERPDVTDRLRLADEMVELLMPVQNELVRIMNVLVAFAPTALRNSFKQSEADANRLDEIDPLNLADGCPLEWLCMDRTVLNVRDFEDQLRYDQVYHDRAANNPMDPLADFDQRVAMIEDLRAATGADLAECKKALDDADGDMETAIMLIHKNRMG